MTKELKPISNPVTNGKTASLVKIALQLTFYSWLAISILFAVIMIVIFTNNTLDAGIIKGHTIINVVYTLTGTYGTISSLLGSVFVICIKSFFETRSATEKSNHKLERKKERHRFKLEKMKLKKGGK